MTLGAGDSGELETIPSRALVERCLKRAETAQYLLERLDQRGRLAPAA